VKAVSQAPPAGDPAPAPAVNNPPPPVQSFDQPFVQDFPPAQPPQIQQQPQPQVQQQPMVQTPFGPIPNPRAQQPVAPAIVPPAQQNTLFPNQPVQQNQPMGQPVIGQPVPGFPTPQPNNANPFGTPTPFGAPNAPPVNQNNPNNGLFGSVPVFNSP